MCMPLWIACVDTPPALCGAWGERWGDSRLLAGVEPSTCSYMIHRLCARKTSALLGRPQSREVIHTRAVNLRLRPRPARQAVAGLALVSGGRVNRPDERARRALAGLSFECVFDPRAVAGRPHPGHRRPGGGEPGRGGSGAA